MSHCNFIDMLYNILPRFFSFKIPMWYQQECYFIADKSATIPDFHRTDKGNICHGLRDIIMLM